MSHRIKRLLVIDDNKTFVMYIGLLLRRMGFEVVAAGNAVEGLRLLKTDPPDGVLLDLVMPDMSGTDILRHIRNDDNLAQLPVIMVSVDGSEKTIEECRKLGAGGFLTKPIRLPRLNAELQQVLQYPGGGRQHLRVSLNRRITVRHGEKTEDLYATSLSEGGIYLRKEEPLPNGTPVEVVLPIGDKMTLSLKGAVIYQRGVYQKYLWVEPGVAVRFDALSEQQTALLQEFISYRLAGDLVEEQKQPVITVNDERPEEDRKRA